MYGGVGGEEPRGSPLSRFAEKAALTILQSHDGIVQATLLSLQDYPTLRQPDRRLLGIPFSFGLRDSALFQGLVEALKAKQGLKQALPLPVRR